MTASLGELADRTPATRERYVDFLRAVSILCVVIGHWTIGMLQWDHGSIRSTSAIGLTSWLWLATWFLQVMPIFFFVGGFSNLVAFDAYQERGKSTGAFIRSRLGRLLRPSLVFLGVWTVVQVTLHLADIGATAGPPLWGDTRLLRGMLPPGATIPFGPLWFLLVYAVVVCISPWTIALHRRFGLWVPAAMVLGTCWPTGRVHGRPSARAVGQRRVRAAVPAPVGHAYGDGSMPRWPRTAFWAMVVAGLAGLILLTNPPLWKLFGDVRYTWFPGIGAYPKSLLGTDVEAVSNAYPPTLCFLLGGVSSIGAVMLLRPRATRWLQHRRPWTFTIAVNSVIMTLFLWHMTAYLLAVLLLWPLGFGRETDSTLRWWLERPLWLVVPGLILFGLISIFGRFERPRRKTAAVA